MSEQSFEIAHQAAGNAVAMADAAGAAEGRRLQARKDKGATEVKVSQLEEEQKSRQTDTEKDVIRQATDGLNNIFKSFAKGIRLSLTDDGSQLVAQIIDTATDEVVRQIPPEELLSLKERISKQIGIILNEQG